MKLKNLILTFLLVLTLSACHKSGQKKEIAVIVPYSSMTQIWHSFEESARAEFSDTSRYNLHFYQTVDYVTEVFARHSYAHDSRPNVERTLRRIKSEGVKPDLIIAYGDYLAHALAGLDNPMLTSTPVLCSGVVHPEWKDLLAGRLNFVVMEARPQVKENLDFISAMGFPNYVVTVMDSTYIDDHIRAHILEQIGNDRQHYRTNLHLEEVDRIQSPNKRDPRTTLIPISIMNPEKNDRHPDIQGAFELNWIFYTQQQGTSFLNIKEDAYSNSAMNYNIGPYFTMTPEYFNLPLINAMNTCIGGYFTPYPSMWKQIHPIVDKLLSGTDPKMIPWGVLEKEYWLDWRLVKSMHPYASDFPSGVKFVNLPWRQRSRLAYWSMPLLLLVMAVLFIIYAIIIPSVMSVRQKRQRKLLYEKAKEAEKSEKQVEYILSENDSYMWRLFPDWTVKFSPSFYRDFGLPEDSVLDMETLLRTINEPERSRLRDLAMSDNFEGEIEMEVMIDLPGAEKPRAILLHTISLSKTGTENDSEMPVQAGLFYFNDEVHNRNEELREAYRRSEEVAEKESFLASMTAAFKEPLNNIVEYSRILAHKFGSLTDEQKEEYGDKVMDNNMQLIELLDEVMGDTKQSRDDKKHMSLKKVSDLMDEVYTNRSVAAKGICGFEFRPGPSDCEIMVNRPVFLQIMDSLVNDAFTSGKGDVTIGWRQEINGDVVIFIENSGTDISECTRMMESMGGRISLYDTHGSQTRIEITFNFTPPLRKRTDF
ncbi:MAG: sensor histidine kinase [Candidatus Cryptobacteroides sp.]